MPERAVASEPAGKVEADSESVFGEFQRRLRAFVSRRVRNSADVEDIVQETFLRIHRHLAEVRGADRLTAWVFQVARSAMVDHFRRRRQPGEPLRDEHELTATPDAAGGTGLAREFEELAACLAPMIETLPRADREAIDLAEIKGLTQRAASARAGVTLSGMKSRVQRARRRLKAMLLDCCRIELDRRGGIVGHEPRDGACQPCRSSSGVQTGAPRPRR